MGAIFRVDALVERLWAFGGTMPHGRLYCSDKADLEQKVAFPGHGGAEMVVLSFAKGAGMVC